MHSEEEEFSRHEGPPLLREEEDFKDVSPTEDLSPTALYSFQQKKPSSNRLAKDIGKASKGRDQQNAIKYSALNQR